MATQIGNAARAGAPKRAIKAKTPKITRKRAPVALQQVKLAEAAPASSTSKAAAKIRELADLNEELEDSRLDLLHQVNVLTEELSKVHEGAALAESEIRQTVAAEMEQLLRDMQASYKDRLAAETCQLEKRLKRQLAKEMHAPQCTDNHSDDEEPDADQAEKARLEEELEQLNDCCVDLLNRLNAAEARESELAAELVVKEKEIESLSHEMDAQTSATHASESAAVEALQTEVSRLQRELEGTNSRVTELDAQLQGVTASLILESKAKEDAAEEAQELRGQLVQLHAQLKQAQESMRVKARQSKMNARAECEMLESQLERAAKENLALKQRLQIALECTPDEKDRDRVPTPHFVALARAQHTAGSGSREILQRAKAQKGDSLLRQAVEASLRTSSPEFSPAIQWTATPDAAQVASGKVEAPVPLPSDRAQPIIRGTAAEAADTFFDPETKAAEQHFVEETCLALSPEQLDQLPSATPQPSDDLEPLKTARSVAASGNPVDCRLARNIDVPAAIMPLELGTDRAEDTPPGAATEPYSDIEVQGGRRRRPKGRSTQKSTAQEAGGEKPPGSQMQQPKRRRKLLDPTPLGLQMALGLLDNQLEDEEDPSLAQDTKGACGGKKKQVVVPLVGKFDNENSTSTPVAKRTRLGRRRG